MLKADILYLFEKRKGEIVTGGELARAFGVSRSAVWKAVRTLRGEGNQIESFPNSGYKLLEQSDGLSEQSVSESLTTQKLGRALELLKTVGSTNQHVKSLNAAALPDGYTVVSNEQTSGRGRQGRPFYSPANEGVYLSVLLKPNISLKDVPLITLCAAVAVCRAVKSVSGIDAGIKWVNDIYYNGKKLCGILSEGVVSAELGTLESVIVGIGINTGSVAKEIENIATSLRSANTPSGIRNRLIAEILNQLEPLYFNCLKNNRKAILEAYTEKLFIIGREVTVDLPGKSFRAVVKGVNDSGELLVTDAEGETFGVSSGETTL